MNKEDYVNLHRILAILKYELKTKLMEENDNYEIENLQSDLEAIDKVMNIFMFEESLDSFKVNGHRLKASGYFRLREYKENL